MSVYVEETSSAVAEELESLAEFEQELKKYENPLFVAAQEELTFAPIGARIVQRVHKRTGVQWTQVRGDDSRGYAVATGILWIPPFVGPSPFYSKPKKQVVEKCTCPCCGSKPLP